MPRKLTISSRICEAIREAMAALYHAPGTSRILGVWWRAAARLSRGRGLVAALSLADLVARYEIIESPQSSQSIFERFRSGIDYLTPPDL